MKCRVPQVRILGPGNHSLSFNTKIQRPETYAA
jgi:hypothetical protein